MAEVEIGERSVERILEATRLLSEAIRDFETLQANGNLYGAILDAWAKLEATVEVEYMRS